MKPDQEDEALIYKSKEPDVAVLQKAFEDTLTELAPYMEECRVAYNDRNNWWPGKTRSQRKSGPNAFPWDGASDIEAPVISSRINSFVAMCVNALYKANIRATPVEAGDMARARVVSSFLKWMIASYIPRFKKEIELSFNYMFERGLAITYVGWKREEQTYLQSVSLDQLAQIDPQLAQSVLDGSADDELIAMLKTVYPSVNDKRAKRALRELRKNGVAEIPVSRQKVNCPYVESLAPDGDFLFPAYTTDPQRAPYCFWRTYMTPQELKNKVVSDGWDEDWVDEVIKRYRGIGVNSFDRPFEMRASRNISLTSAESEDLVEIVYGYQKLIDSEDNSIGVYCTIFNRELTGRLPEGVKPYAKFELINGVEEYPVVVTRLFNESKRLYDTSTFPALLRGSQMQVKVERDSRIDRNSMATLPPLLHPVGNAPTDWRPGGLIPYRRQGEFQFGPQPQYNAGSAEMETTMLRVADEQVGLNPERVDSVDLRQYFVSRALSHVQDVVRMAFKAFQRFGPEQVFFRVTGVADPMRFDRGNPDENFDIIIGYDVLNSDPENQETKLNALVSLFQFDRNGRINVDSFVELAANAIDPVMADYVLQPAEQASQQIVKHVTDDLTKIFSGIEMPARPNGAQIALQTIQQYASQPDIAQRLQQDEAFKMRLEKYHNQYIFQIQQARNAEIGRVGTAPASMGGVQTQNLQ